jgi:ubiquinone/menaquinone biosynthesis C-methylase UbiE
MFNDSKETIKRTFDASAQKFDEIGTPFFRYFGKIVAEVSEINSDDIVLDIACGKGAVTFPIAANLSGKGHIYAIDFSQKMIQECKEVMKSLNHQNIEFLEMDAENLEFPDNSIDKIVSGFGLFFLPDIEKGLREIRRVLKPGGLMVFSSWNNEFQLKWYMEIISKYIPQISRNLEDENKKITEKDFRTMEGLNKILNLSHFQKEQIFAENIDCFYNNEEEWIETRWHTAHRMILEQLPTEEYDKFKIEIIEQLQHYKVNDKIKITQAAFITKARKINL